MGRNFAHVAALLGSLKVDQLGRDLNNPDAIRAGITGPVMDRAVIDKHEQVKGAPTPEGAVREALDELRGVFESEFKQINDRIDAEVKAGKGEDAVDVDQLGKIVERLDAIEAKGNKLMSGRKLDDETRDAIEREAVNAERAGLAPMSAEAKAAFWQAARYGVQSLDLKQTGLLLGADRHGDRIEGKALTLGNQSTGGFLAPSEFVAEIIKGVVNVSPIRELARVRPTSSKSSLHPKRTAVPTAVWEGENDTTTETGNPAYGLLEVPNHKLRAFVTISTEDLEDSVFDLESELRADVTEQFGVAEGLGFCTGSGVGQPEGLWTNADVANVVSGSAAAITADGLIDLYFELHEHYWNQATFLLRRATLKTARKFKDGQGNYLWQPGIAGTATPATILDSPYRMTPDAPAQGANTYPVMFGAIRMAYVISDRVAISVKRDEFSNGAAENDNVNFWFRKRVGGQVVLSEALKKLKCSL